MNPTTTHLNAAIWPADHAHVQAAARCWQQGGLVAFPTETVYGLGADALQDAAVERIFETKHRPSNHPLIVHVANASQALTFVRLVPPAAQRLMQHAWPGPLTLILPKREGVASLCAGGQNSLGVRCPSHPVAQALLQAAHALGVAGIAGPSANRFGRVSPTQAEHVVQEFNAQVPVVDGGDCDVGIESTIVDASRDQLVILRPGHYTAAQLSQWAGTPVAEHDTQAHSAPRASGTLASHYAPQAKVLIKPPAQLQQDAHRLPAHDVAVWSPQAKPRDWPGLWVEQPTQPERCAHDLFALLRRFDAAGVREIWVAQVPTDPAWSGVADRLQRAAA